MGGELREQAWLSLSGGVATSAHTRAQRCSARSTRVRFLQTTINRAEALADHLIARRFHKAGAHPLSSPIAPPIVRNEPLVVLNIRVELLHGFQALSGRAMATGGHRGIEVHRDGLPHLQGLVD